MNRIDIQKVERSIFARTKLREYRIQVEVEGPATQHYPPYRKIQLVRWMNRRESFGFIFACMIAMHTGRNLDGLVTKVDEMLDAADSEWKEMQNERS